MGHIYIPTKGPDDWRSLLADPDAHWKPGYSAMAIATCWEDAQGFPPEILHLFSESGVPTFHGIEFLLAFPEHKVSLAGKGPASQNDIFVLAKAHDGHLVSITIEGKASEPFGDKTVREWISGDSENKKECPRAAIALQYIIIPTFRKM